VQYYEGKTLIEISGTFRQGDIRHNFADLTKIRSSIGFTPRFTFRAGLEQFLDWAGARSEVLIGYESSLKEMFDRGLLSA
jgi:dTDP-L-rhamnose 4-epimerase